jgi:diguanylate cyclase (GGDEF)-like protein
MFSVDPLLGTLAAAVVVLVIAAALLTAALIGRGSVGVHLPGSDRSSKAAPSGEGDVEAEEAARRARMPAQPVVRLLTRERRPVAREDVLGRRAWRASDDELDEVLRGKFAVDTYNKAVRVLAWSFILTTLLIVLLSQLWEPVQPEIFITLILAGIAVLVVHEALPPGSLRTARVVMEGSGAILFLTMLVLLTGRASSPFFFLYPLLVAGAALVAAPRVTVTLALETAAAYGVAALTGPMDATSMRDTLARVAINLTALVLLAYSGMVVSRVQRRTRNAAIRLSTIDSLTDLYNRAFLFNAVDREIQRARRFRRGFCLLMMDLDGLKSINDGYGHFQGDVVLRGVAQTIRAGLRGIDVAARYGGDEFVALLPETDPAGAYVVAEKIRQMASELLVESGGEAITTSLSIGVVSYPVDGMTADELMIAADDAMYSSKRLGKNRVVGYAEPNPGAAPAASSHRVQGPTQGFRSLPRQEEEWHVENGERR